MNLTGAERTAKYRANHPARVKAQSRRARRDNHDAILAAQYRWRIKNPDVWKALKDSSYLRRNYGISIKQLTALRRAQGYRCAICRKRPSDGKFRIDHDHKTNRVRGLLCFRCNIGLGHFGDSLKGLRAAVKYLDRHAEN